MSLLLVVALTMAVGPFAQQSSAASGEMPCAESLVAGLNPQAVLSWSAYPIKGLTVIGDDGHVTTCGLSPEQDRAARARALRFRVLDFSVADLQYAAAWTLGMTTPDPRPAEAITDLYAYALFNNMNEVYQSAMSARPVALVYRCGETLIAAQYEAASSAADRTMWRDEASRVCRAELAQTPVLQSTAPSPPLPPVTAGVDPQADLKELLKMFAFGVTISAGPGSGIGQGLAEGLSAPAGVPRRPFLDVCVEPLGLVNSLDDVKRSIEYLTCQSKNQAKLMQWQACLAKGESVCMYR